MINKIPQEIEEERRIEFIEEIEKGFYNKGFKAGQKQDDVLKDFELIRKICARIQLQDGFYSIEDIYKVCNEKIAELKAGSKDGKED
jgi:hypothetical protein